MSDTALLNDYQATNGSTKTLPEIWRVEIESRLPAGILVLDWVEVDLDATLHFGRGVVVLTTDRVIARGPGETVWQEWYLRAELELSHFDHAGVGTLELIDQTRCLGSWRYTLANNLDALRLINEFKIQLVSRISGNPPVRDADDVCPKCKTPLEPGSD